jgi:hypothetical protein
MLLAASSREVSKKGNSGSSASHRAEWMSRSTRRDENRRREHQANNSTGIVRLCASLLHKTRLLQLNLGRLTRCWPICEERDFLGKQSKNLDRSLAPMKRCAAGVHAGHPRGLSPGAKESIRACARAVQWDVGGSARVSKHEIGPKESVRQLSRWSIEWSSRLQPQRTS